jgi:NAD(P)-dependent dehydrogenase (short-subunit alcohol dehydrogenase family)
MYLEKYDLSGQTAFITGGGRGIGLAAAEALLEAGARVIISDVDPNVLDQGRSELAGKGRDVDAVRLDVTDADAVGKAASELNARYRTVDILIANAGIAWPDTPGEAMSDEVWRKIIDVDLNGVFWSCREFGRPMLERGRGSIVTIGSISGLISNRPQRQAHYNAAKAGEWAERGVRVNSVVPTYVDTAMSRGGFTDDALFPIWMENTPMQRVARADEIASAILFLSSDASSAMTGSLLLVDCGYTIW